MNDVRVRVGGKVKAAVKMENDMRDEGCGVVLCANIGDHLIVKEIKRNGLLVVSRSSDGYEFICGINEISN